MINRMNLILQNVLYVWINFKTMKKSCVFLHVNTFSIHNVALNGLRARYKKMNKDVRSVISFLKLKRCQPKQNKTESSYLCKSTKNKKNSKIMNQTLMNSESQTFIVLSQVEMDLLELISTYLILIQASIQIQQPVLFQVSNHLDKFK